MKPKRTIGGIIRVGLFSGLFFLLFLELGCLATVKLNLIPAPAPDYKWPSLQNAFLGDINPHFGVWHFPDREYQHEKSCFSVTYRTNSAGAVDKERSLQSDNPRTIVLGDSFVEGYGVEREERFSDRLETLTGREHLNFGTSGNFGPTQYYLLYQHMASQYEHDTVIVSVLPDNDFKNDKPKKDRYMPYWEGTYPDYRLSYTLESLEDSSWSRGTSLDKRLDKQVNSILRHYTYTKNVYDWVSTVLKSNSKNEVFGSGKGFYSGYKDYKQEELNRLFHSLMKIKEIAHDKRVLVITIPRLADFKAVASSGNNPLARELTQFATTNDIEYIDLLPLMDDKSHGEIEKLFHTCDGHWSPYGHEVAADVLLSIY